MSIDRRKIGELDCAILDSPGCDEKISAVAIICHGYGAGGEDLVPCAPELYSSVPDGLDHVRFVFPAAPIELEPGGLYDSRAWWPIDMDKLQQIMESGQVRDLSQDRPEMLDERNRQLKKVLAEVIAEAGIGYEKLILGGFSQGSMLATEVALSIPESIGGLVVWSGTLLSESTWRERAANKSGMRVLQAHGRTDPILPYAGAELLRDMFNEFKIDVEFVDFEGQHTIAGEAIEKAASLIADVANA